MALWGLGYKNGDWIWELAFGGGIFRVIFGLGGLCLLLFVPIDEEGFVIMEVGDVGVVIFLFLIVFPVLNWLALHFWDSLSNSKSSSSDSVNSQFNRHVVVASPLEPRSHSLGIRNYINQLMGSLLNPLAISILLSFVLFIYPSGPCLFYSPTMRWYTRAKEPPRTAMWISCRTKNNWLRVEPASHPHGTIFSGVSE